MEKIPFYFGFLFFKQNTPRSFQYFIAEIKYSFLTHQSVA